MKEFLWVKLRIFQPTDWATLVVITLSVILVRMDPFFAYHLITFEKSTAGRGAKVRYL